MSSQQQFLDIIQQFLDVCQQFLDYQSTIFGCLSTIFRLSSQQLWMLTTLASKQSLTYSKWTRAGFQLYQTWLFWFYDSWWPHSNGIPCLARKCASNLIIVRDMYMCVGVNDTWNAYHVLHCFTKCSLQVLEWLPAWDSLLYQQVTLVH